MTTHQTSSTNPSGSTLLLYHFQSCPYCAKVRRYLQERGISIPMKDIHLDPSARQELVQIGGKGQVPCLIIDGAPLYESNDIIQWFERHWPKHTS